MVKTMTVSNHLRAPNFRSWSMKTILANAFTVDCLQQIQEFHLWQLNPDAPKYPCSSFAPVPGTNIATQALSCYSMLVCPRHGPAWSTLGSSKWQSWARHHTIKCRSDSQEFASTKPDTQPKDGPDSFSKNATTSFSTATTLIYTIEAGITAAAGTRLALQLLLIKWWGFYSFQLQDKDALHYHFLSLPHCARIG